MLGDTDTLEKEASNAILYPTASVLLRRGSARALDGRVRAGSGGQRVGVQGQELAILDTAPAHIDDGLDDSADTFLASVAATRPLELP